MSSIAMETRRLGRRYGARWALRDCSLRLPAGGVVGLVGPNGAGKTTLLRLAVGVLTPSAGEITVLGRAVTDRPASLAAVGFVGQDKPLYPGFTVAEMLRFGAKLNPCWDDATARERLAALRIPLDQRAGRLSGGQQAQVALALALGKQPQVLLLDEPVASLDPLARRQFFQTLMEEVAASQLTVILSSHLLDDLDRSCDYLVLLSASRVQLSGPTEELLASHRALTGPADRVQALATQRHTIVQVESTGRLARILVRLSGQVHDPAWTVRDVTLEELVLAYMSHPDSAPPTQPTLAEVQP
jgi:ABC-2 type transport system ATP-binding protein